MSLSCVIDFEVKLIILSMGVLEFNRQITREPSTVPNEDCISSDLYCVSGISMLICTLFIVMIQRHSPGDCAKIACQPYSECETEVLRVAPNGGVRGCLSKFQKFYQVPCQTDQSACIHSSLEGRSRLRCATPITCDLSIQDARLSFKPRKLMVYARLILTLRHLVHAQNANLPSGYQAHRGNLHM